MARKTQKFDADKLRAEFRKRGLTLTNVSREIGYSDSYISWTLQYGSITDSVAKMLDSQYNIKPESYIIPDEPAAEPEPATYDGGIDYHKLYHTIYGAVYQAMKRALSE